MTEYTTDSIKVSDGYVYDLTLSEDTCLYLQYFDATLGISKNGVGIDAIYSPIGHTCSIAQRLGYNITTGTAFQQKNINVRPLNPFNQFKYYPTLEFVCTNPNLGTFQYVLPQKDKTLIRGHKLVLWSSTPGDINEDNDAIHIVFADGTEVYKNGQAMLGTYYNVAYFIWESWEGRLPFTNWNVAAQSSSSDTTTDEDGFMSPLLTCFPGIGPVSYTITTTVLSWRGTWCSCEKRAPTHTNFYDQTPSALITLPFYLTGDTNISIMGSDY